MKLNEGLDYQDMKGQIDPKITVDEYAAKIGSDSDIVTLAFKTNSKLAANDLESWLELGYKFILDASVSDGEVEPGKWLVFVEMKRRHDVPKNILNILEDLETLTGREPSDYKIWVDDTDHVADVDTLKKAIILSPSEYEQIKGTDVEDQESEPESPEDAELNEMRSIAGLGHKPQYTVDEEIRRFISNAGL